MTKDLIKEKIDRLFNTDQIMRAGKTKEDIVALFEQEWEEREKGGFDLIKALKLKFKLFNEVSGIHNKDWWEGMNFGFEQTLSVVEDWLDSLSPKNSGEEEGK